MLGHPQVARSSRRLRVPVSLCLVAIATACSTTELEFPSAVGVWNLETVNGGSLPAVLSDDGTTVESISRGLFLIDVATCILDATYLSTVNGTPQQPEPVGRGCTWRQDGADLLFDFGDSNPLDGSIEGTQITVSDEAGFVFVYERA